MTDSTDNARGPERIIILCDEANYLCAAKFPASPDENDLVIYTRADLAPDPLADARVARMIDALRYYADPKTYEPDKRYANEPWPIFDDEGAMARAALAAFDTTGGNADGL